MASLIAKSAGEGLLPVTIGSCKLLEQEPQAITSIAPAKGHAKAVSKTLQTALGLGFPAPNRTTGQDGQRCVWTGPEQAFLIGPQLPSSPPLANAAITDQSDAWIVLRLTGRDAEAVLARLVPIDLRQSVFKRGHTARTLMFHVSISITRTGANSFDLLAFRSMATTAVEELSAAMKSVAAQSRDN